MVFRALGLGLRFFRVWGFRFWAFQGLGGFGGLDSLGVFFEPIDCCFKLKCALLLYL